ncbi:MAG: hypothetical protein IH944_00920 [Armatimonadetes bacterium]|nr:hypothetical protein [Armatimonadota bacterium]
MQIKNPLRHGLCVAMAAGLLFGLATCALSHKRDLVWSYEWWVAYEGERELEFWFTDFGGGKSDVWLEFEYGVDGHYMVAPYLLMERDGSDLRVVGWKFEQRYSFGEFAFDRVLPGLYFEVKKEGGEAYELEAKLITTVAFSSGYNWTTNIIAEGKADGKNAVEWEYSTGVSFREGRKLSYGIEAFGNITKQRHFVGPTIGLQLDRGQKVLVGYGVSTKGAPGRLRLIFEWEF